jgi:hypothetical protein
MPKTQLIIRKVLEGRIAHNDGDFAEIETTGTEGIESTEPKLQKSNEKLPEGGS